ncbi:putative SP-containing protein [Vairimorpha necatrix]|uniref:SP-containing protein n=1 Tax=Vairimorpha necatrix TaxID=6039 RepID=A0AAX4J961_9MICR
MNLYFPFSLFMLLSLAFRTTNTNENDSGWVVNIVNFTKKHVDHIHDFLINLKNNKFSKEDIIVKLDQLRDKYPHESWTAVKVAILSCYDILNTPASVYMDGKIVEKIVQNNKQEKVKTENNLESVIPNEERDALSAKIIMGNFAGVPKNLLIEDDFINYLLDRYTLVDIDQYNNISKFLHLVKDNKVYAYEEKVIREWPSNSVILGTTKGWENVLIEMIVILINRDKETYAFVKEVLKLFDDYFKNREKNNL